MDDFVGLAQAFMLVLGTLAVGGALMLALMTWMLKHPD